MTSMDVTTVFAEERPRLVRIATRVLGERGEAEDVVQNAWLRLHNTVTDASTEIDNLPGWLTTVTTRLCLDRLRAKTPIPTELETENAEPAPDPAEEVALADTVGVALQVVLDRLTPAERVAFVLHDSFGIDFPTIAAILGGTPVAARKLASRARAKIALSHPEKQPATDEHQADWAVVDAFLAAARQGDFTRLVQLLAPDAVVIGDNAAVALGTPSRIDGARPVAEMFNGAAKAALSVFVADRPGAAWYHQGTAKVAFDFTITGGVVRRIDFRADPAILKQVTKRKGPSAPTSSPAVSANGSPWRGG